MTGALRLAALGLGWLVAGATSAAEPFSWESATPESQGMSGPKLDALKDALAARKTHTFLVVRNDKIVYEWYAPGHGPAKPHGTASLAKALVGGLSLAVALTDGRVALDDPVAKFVPQWRIRPGSRLASKRSSSTAPSRARSWSR